MEPFSAIVLAGGRGRRMGRDKVWLDAGGRPLIARVVERLAPLSSEVIVVRASLDGPFPPLPVRLVEDRYPGQGPLAGVHAGLSAAATPWAFVVACDMPFLDVGLIRYLALLRPGHDAVVPYPAGRPEPLHAFYHRRCLLAVEELLGRGDRALAMLHLRVRSRPVSRAELTRFDPSLDSFTNVNTPEEWERARRVAGWDEGSLAEKRD